MFRSFEPLSGSSRLQARQYVKRAGLFAAGLLLLWVALQLVPSSTAHPPVFSDDAGTVATNASAEPRDRGPDLFSLGNLAAYAILIGGAVFAFVTHRRSRSGKGGTSLIEPLAELGVGQGQQLRLVQCGGSVLLIGVTTHHITVLRDFDPRTFDDSSRSGTRGPQAAASPLPRPDATADRTHFADILQQVAGRYAPAQPNGTTC